jgi:hypothetical protein
MPDRLARLMDATSAVPVINQIEVHPYSGSRRCSRSTPSTGSSPRHGRRTAGSRTTGTARTGAPRGPGHQEDRGGARQDPGPGDAPLAPPGSADAGKRPPRCSRAIGPADRNIGENERHPTPRASVALQPLWVTPTPLTSGSPSAKFHSPRTTSCLRVGLSRGGDGGPGADQFVARVAAKQRHRSCRLAGTASTSDGWCAGSGPNLAWLAAWCTSTQRPPKAWLAARFIARRSYLTRASSHHTGGPGQPL